MKVIGCILILVIIVSCNQEKKKTQERLKNDDFIATKKIISRDEVPMKAINNLEKEDTIPSWMKNAYETEIDHQSYVYEQTVIKYGQINDSISWGIVEQHTGTCSPKVLVTHSHQKEIAREIIEEICDHDLSVPRYKWKDFNYFPPNKIIVYEYEESVHDSFLNERGSLKNGYDYLELDKHIDSIEVIIEIEESGQIKKE